MKSLFFSSVLRVENGKTTAQLGLHSGYLFRLFVEVSGEAMLASTATLSVFCTSDEASCHRRIQNPDLASTEKSDRVVTGQLKIHEQCKILPYPYQFDTSNEVKKMLDDFYTSSFYA